jgi:hypothetical protein
MAWFFRKNRNKNETTPPNPMPESPVNSVPVVTIQARDGQAKTIAESYLGSHLSASVQFGGAVLKGMIPEDIESLLKASPPTNRADIEGIASRIRAFKIIPILGFAPDELKYRTDKDVWWFIPAAAFAGQYFSWVAVTKNGLYVADPDDENDGALICPWGSIRAVECVHSEERVCCLNISTTAGVFTVAEFVSGDKASSLPVVSAIYDVHKPVIGASRGERMWSLGAGGEDYLRFESVTELARESAWTADQLGDESDSSNCAESPDVSNAESVTLEGQVQVLAYILHFVAAADGAMSEEERCDIVESLRAMAPDDEVDTVDGDLFAAVACYQSMKRPRDRRGMFKYLLTWMKTCCTPEQLESVLQCVDGVLRVDGHVAESSRKRAAAVATAWELDFAFAEIDSDADGAESGDDGEASSDIQRFDDDDVEYLGPNTIPAYPGEFYFVVPTLAGYTMHVKLFPAVSRVNELFRRFSEDEVDSICNAIRSERVLPELAFVRDILDEVCMILPDPEAEDSDTDEIVGDDGSWQFAFKALTGLDANVQDTAGAESLREYPAPTWFVPLVVCDPNIQCALWLSMSGVFLNNRSKPRYFMQHVDAEELKDLHLTERRVCGDEVVDGCASLEICCDDEFLDVMLTEFHGAECGSQFRIISCCWELMKEVIERSRGEDSWDWADIQVLECDSWEDILEWAATAATAAAAASGSAGADSGGSAHGGSGQLGLSDRPARMRKLNLGPDLPGQLIDAAVTLHGGGQPIVFSIREVFGWFGYQRRAVRTLAEVESALSHAKLEAFPALKGAPMDSPVQLRLRSPVTPGSFVIEVLRDTSDDTAGGSWAKPGDPNMIVVPMWIERGFADMARSVLETGKTKRITVCDLLRWFGVERRGSKVQTTIAFALEQLHLETFPDFAIAHIDRIVEVKLAPTAKPGVYSVERAK